MSKNKRELSRAEQKRREREARRNREITQSDGTKTPFETICWIVGVVVMLFSLFLFLAVLSHLFVWEHDYALLNSDSTIASGAARGYSNPCSGIGARLADALVGGSLGLCGILVPIVLFLVGLNLIIGHSKVLWHTNLSIALIAIFGSLSLGLLGDTETFGSGWGGAFGALVVDRLSIYIGGLGVGIVLVACWIITGVVINRNFINILNRATLDGVDKSKGLAHSLGSYIAQKSEARKERKRRRQESLAKEGGDERRILSTNGDEVERAEQTEPQPIAESATPTETTKAIESAATVVEPAVSTPASGDTAKEVGTIEVITHEDKTLSEKEVDTHVKERHHTPSYKFPTVDLLVSHDNGATVSDEEILSNKQRIEETLANFGVPISSMTATIGPTVTLYEIVQEAGVKISKVQGLEKDIAQSLKALGIRIIAPIPGKGTIGIEVPNRNKETVSMRSAIQSERFQNYKAELPVVIGRTIQNENFVFDLAKMPHLLVAGATGQGKSVGLNAIITSLLYRKDPSQLKFVLIDPKTVEFSLYAKLEQHYLAKMESEEDTIVKDPKKAVYTLNSLCIEMENRLAKCGKAGVRNIVEYNDMVRKNRVEDDIMPYIVVVIDEFADLIMTAKEVEQPVMRLAQKARAVGIHLIVATQRPDVKVITGGIKANFPARIAFRVMQMIDSRTIIDQPGANQLIGRGDMLFSNGGELTRIQCAFVDTPEVRDIVEHISDQPHPLNGTYMLPDYEDSSSASGGDMGLGSESGAPMRTDPMLAEIARDIVSSGRFSVSYVQSNYEVGFNRAGRIAQQLERIGVIGPANGSKPRDVRIYDLQSLEEKLQELGIG